MRCLERNKVDFYYCPIIKVQVVLDANGFETGENRMEYSEATVCRGNVSKTYGEAQVEQFGNSTEYDRVIIVEDLNCPIDENSVLFVDREPTYDKDGNPMYDYIVKRVAHSLSSGSSYAVKKVR